MSKFEAFFEQYVYGLMLPDVSREIVRASRDENTANFLCALGLLCYTEALGHWVPEAKKGSRNKFEAFFRRLGPLYAEFLDNGEDPGSCTGTRSRTPSKVRSPSTWGC